jgi:hypothetical protein
MAKTFNYGAGIWATKTGSSMAYNDQNDNYKPTPFSVTRDSIATRVNKQGLIEVVGHDKLRIDYTDSSNGVALLEPSRSNLFTYSEDASQWGSSGITTPISQDGSVNNPDGVSGANEITPTSGSSLKFLFPNNTHSFTSGDTYSFSVFVKANELKYIQITGNTNAFGSGQYANFDLENGVIGTYAGATSGTTPKIEYYGNGWYRCQFQANASATTTQNIFLIAIVPSASASRLQALNPNGTDSLYVYGFQAEAGSYATSYIPTSGQSGGVTRAADEANGAGNEQVFNDSEGVLFADIAALANDGTNRRISLSDESAATSNRIVISYKVGDNEFRAFVNAGGAVPFDTSQTISNTLIYNKTALKYKSGDYAFWVNGFELQSSTSSNTPTGLDDLSFDSDNTLPFYGKTKEIGYYDATLTDAELEALTSYTSFTNMANELNLTIK